MFEIGQSAAKIPIRNKVQRLVARRTLQANGSGNGKHPYGMKI